MAAGLIYFTQIIPPHVPREYIGKSPNNAVTKHSIFFEIVTHFDQVLYLYVFGMKPKTNQCQSTILPDEGLKEG